MTRQSSQSTFQLIIEDITPQFSQEEIDNGWNEENYKLMATLLKEVKSLENAHRDCRDLNRKANNTINISLMLFAGATTVMVALSEKSNLGNVYYYVECGITGVTTILTGLNTYYHNDANQKEHHLLSRHFYKLGNKIKLSMVNNRKNVKFDEIYKKYAEKVSTIRESSLSIFTKIRKKYNISDKIK